MRYLSVEQVILFHEISIKKFGGRSGIRDLSLLESAIFRPQTQFAGVFLYTNVYTKAASLIHGIIKNHPFVDGNKRTGLLSLYAFLKLNGYKLVSDKSDIVTFTISIADGSLSLDEIAYFIKKHSFPVSKS